MISRTIQSYIPNLIDIRHDLHRHPEISGQEKLTAERVLNYVKPFEPDRVLERLGGHGLAFCYKGEHPGPTIMLRCELDALPITEINTFGYRSTVPGVSHKCGHDGHMSILIGMARLLHEHPITHGQVVLLFQPAEENGEGAKAVLHDETFLSIRPDFAFALHNLPGYPQGQLQIRNGAMACASRGMHLTLLGKTSHAAWPEDGKIPAIAMCRIIEGLTLLPHAPALQHCFNLVSVVQASLGRDGFGTVPGEANISATLRSDHEDGIQLLIQQSNLLIEQWLAIHGLEHTMHWSDIFELSVNDTNAADFVRKAAQNSQIPVHEMPDPLRASEDFGVFTQQFPGTLFGLGSGEQSPQLHNPDYDFPDDIIEYGVQTFWNIVQECINQETEAQLQDMD